MEYVPGRTLRDLLNERGSLPREALDIMEGVLGGLGAAHAAGLAHRDVKPENVLLTSGHAVKVADFGLARMLAGTSQTKTGMLIGTAAYLAPEQVSRGVADARTDVYAAGILLFEMLTGQQPHTADTPLAVAYKHVNEAVPAPSQLVDGIPPALDDLVLRATSRDPDLRPADGGQFLHSLNEMRLSLPPAPPAPAAAAYQDPGYPALAPYDTPGYQNAGLPKRGVPERGVPDAPGYQTSGYHTPGYQDPGYRQSGYHDPGHQPGGWPAQPPPSQYSDDLILACLAPVGARRRRCPGRAHQRGRGLPHHGLSGQPGFARLNFLRRRIRRPARRGSGRGHPACARWRVTLGRQPHAGGDPRRGQGLRPGPGWLRRPPRARPAALAVQPQALLRTRRPGRGASDRPARLVAVGGQVHHGAPVRGLAANSARLEVRNEGLTVKMGTPQFSAGVPRGNVVATNPAIGSRVSKGGTVLLIVSKGPHMIPVPQVTGNPLASAEAALKQAGLTPGKVTGQTPTTIQSGIVISTTPAATVPWAQGRPVNLVVSSGQPVPNPVGQQKAVAEQWAQANSVSLNEVADPNSDQPAGTVTRQSLPPNSSFTPHQVITIDISNGPQMVNVPSVDGQQVSQAEQALAQAGFQVKVVQVGPLNDVFHYSPQGQPPAGSTITLYVGLP